MNRWHLLPKVDLHVHLDGSLRPDTAMAIAAAEGIELPAGDEAGLIPYMQVDDDCRSLPEYLSKFDFTTQFMQSGAALERVAYETLAQAASHNCRYIEVRFAPQLHRRRGLQSDETIHHVITGMKRAEQEFDIVGRVIAICMRHHERQLNLEVIEAAAKFEGKGLVAVDLAGDEASFPPELFREVFALAHKRSLPVTIHAGEAAGAQNVYEAVKNLGASRIGHGVRLRENPAILQMILEQRIPLEMCPVSNIQTKAVADWDVYPIREYFEKGLLVTLNTDNPSVSGTDITREYRIVSERFDFTDSELAAMIRNGVNAAFLEDSAKKVLKQCVEQNLAALGIK
ncbi:adenosine deaminase [Paenibacillus sp. OV219]|uniref:adenosine deaminase n=1 Tax=Paenibacillus sp. OV219 TaxID=1884377 RepID=UPI0008D2D4A9|nr:adenosine deaminase [Paenibacillus sp. OV219]SEN56416.1 adenosine deaminase [Paenibacillus sp. OV219]